MSKWCVLTADGDTFTAVNAENPKEQLEVYLYKDSIYVYASQQDGLFTELKIPRANFETFLHEVNDLVFPYQNEGT